jgi:RNA polymerase sigma-70 factor (TIGR02943 family)
LTTSEKNKLFADWVAQYTDKMYSWAYHKTSNKELAEDLVQETFLSAFKAIDDFNFDSQPKTWLFRILNNKIIDYYRKKARSIESSTEDEILSRKATDNLFDSKEHWNTTTTFGSWEEEEHLLDNLDFNNVLASCISKLPVKWRGAIESKYQSDKSAAEICKELNITSSNYWQLIHRAKLQLKICLEQNWTN